MNKDIILCVENLSKIYKLYNNPIDRLKETIHPLRKKYHKDFYALKNVNFEIKKGDTVGIVGRNGSGKSTLLKLITGVLTPTSGHIYVNGKIAALLELGAGFNPEFTGIENIYLNGTIMGYTRREMDEKIDDIVTFADIGDFIYQPVKMYSSGMFARLAFSVNANVNPDILIVDEALSVGDMFFQAKCIDRMKRMMRDGVTILFVSHDIAGVKSLCRRGILLDNGNLLLNASSEEVAEKYFKIKVQNEQQVTHIPKKNESAIEKQQFFGDNSEFLKRSQYQRIQNGKVEFYNIQLLNEAETEVSQVYYGQKVILRMSVIVNEDMKEFGYGYHIRNASGVDLVYSDSIIENKGFYNVKKDSKFIIDWEFVVSLQEGAYNIACGMSIPIDLEIGKVDFCDFVPCAIQFLVQKSQNIQLYGYTHWDNKVNVIAIESD